jgi:hypothetical protein
MESASSVIAFFPADSVASVQRGRNPPPFILAGFAESEKGSKKITVS